jgi:DNA repair exonuclease SbcCD nuclease subunit
MKIALLTDTHFGVRNDSLLFHHSFVRFYDDVFFPELRKRGINTIVHLGDLFDRRKYINFHVLYRTRKDFVEQLANGGYETHFLVGNHDTYFKDTNSINSIRELIDERYERSAPKFKNYDPSVRKLFHIYEEPEEIVLDGRRILLVPWLNTTNMTAGLEMIANSTAKVLFGHLEIAGFHMDQNQICEHGLDKNIFANYDAVFSGHFHHASQNGPVRYLGAPYEMTFADLNDPKGFHIFDTDTLDLEFVQNPYKMFYRLVYDDRENKEQLLETNFSEYENKFIKLIVPHKTDPVLYDKWMDSLLHANPADLNVNEILSLEIGEEVDEQFQEFDENNQVVVVSDTLTVLNTYVDGIGLEVDKTKLKDIMRELYVEATAGKA